MAKEEDDFFWIAIVIGIMWYVSQNNSNPTFAPIPAPTGSW